MLEVARWALDVPPLLPLLIFTVLATAAAESPLRITNRQFPDGSGSSREVNPGKRQSVETFYNSAGKITHKAVTKLDDHLAPVSAIFYNASNVIYQKSTYRLDGEDRIIQEVIYDGKDNLIGTKNFTYGSRNGSAIVVNVDIYDANGNLIQTPRLSKSGKKNR